MGKKKGNVRVLGPNKAAKAAMQQLQQNPMEEFMNGIPPEEMVHLPPPPDRNYQIFWPIHETFTMDHKRFMVIYPSYLDSTKTIKQGRRIGKEHAVDTPTVSDISQALQSLGLRHVLQPHKGYSRDPYTLWDNPGRVKVETSVAKIVELDDDDKENALGNAKRQLLLEIASRIPSLPSRIQRLEHEAAAKKAAEEEAAQKQKQLQQQQQQQSAQQKQQASSSKKKGKKKR
ncbi:signal recognition particle SRP19 [Nitzschia inconspicua]|uniref:Signal recognition particle SRP19 n=1 Tax=Nitzschia inconspicua TaxID=303405 RepID=A0A9K3LLH0_9STRA|nr:signal recognition particle SRP19 [Nitzschia inconspicua]